MTRFVGILSGKGGVAKTTTTVNLGAAFNYFGRDVTVVDGNLSTPNLGLHLGIPVVPISLHDALKGKHSIVESMYKHGSGLKVIPASLSLLDLKDVAPSKLSKVLPSLDGLTDIVLIDGAPGLGSEAMAVIKSVDEIIIITNPEMPAVTDALKSVKVARDRGKEVKGVIVTRHRNASYEMPLSSIKSMLETPIIGVIPEDKAVKESVMKRDAVVHTHPRSKVAKKYHEIARKVAGEAEEAVGFFRRIFG